jgi:hypothetical protein
MRALNCSALLAPEPTVNSVSGVVSVTPAGTVMVAR